MIRELAKLIGTERKITYHGVTLMVRILDVRQTFGRVDVQIENADQPGPAVWVARESLR